MKKFTIIGCICAVLAAWGIVGAKMSRLENHTRQTSAVTTSATTNLSVKTDTIWLNRQVAPLDGGQPFTLNLRQYAGFRCRVVVGPMAPGDTTLLHNAGVVDTVSFVVKKKLGTIVSLVDSAAQTVVRLRSAADTRTISFLIGTGATDTLNADELFGILRVADSTSDTAGIIITYPITTETYFKE